MASMVPATPMMTAPFLHPAAAYKALVHRITRSPSEGLARRDTIDTDTTDRGCHRTGGLQPARNV